jgi:ArsR family transcriptional regulator
MIDTAEVQDRRRGTRCCDDSIALQLNSKEAQQLSDDLQMLGHPVRLQILDLLASRTGRICVCDLEAVLPVKQPTISHHLKLLRDAGLIDCERQGLWAYYYIQKEAVAALHKRVAGMLERLD